MGADRQRLSITFRRPKMRKGLLVLVVASLLCLVVQHTWVYADQRSGEGHWVCWTLYGEDNVLVPFGVPHDGSIVTAYFQVYYGYIQVYATSVGASSPAAPWCGRYPFDVGVVQGSVWYSDGRGSYSVSQLINTGCVTQPCTVAVCHYSPQNLVLYLGAMHGYSTSMLRFEPDCTPLWCSHTVSN